MGAKTAKEMVCHALATITDAAIVLIRGMVRNVEGTPTAFLLRYIYFS
jgi:hypothetical protein